MLIDDQTDITESFIKKLEQETMVTPILVYCPINRLIRNVASRNSSGSEYEQRSPLTVANQYLNMYFSRPETPVTPHETLIDFAEESEFHESIEELSHMTLHEECEKKLQQNDIARLRSISSHRSSPVYVQSNLYAMTFKNDGKNDSPTKLRNLFGMLYQRLFPSTEEAILE